MNLATIIILGLATYRAARLIAIDGITEPIRSRIYDWGWDDDGEPLHEPTQKSKVGDWAFQLINCPHCVSVWIAAAFYAIWEWCWDWAYPLVILMSIAGVASLLASLAGKLDE